MNAFCMQGVITTEFVKACGLGHDGAMFDMVRSEPYVIDKGFLSMKSTILTTQKLIVAKTREMFPLLCPRRLRFFLSRAR